MKWNNITISENIYRIICFIYFYLAIFGPKLESYFDISVMTNCFVIIIASMKGRIKINKKVNQLLLITIAVIFYSLLVSFWAGNVNITFVFKFVRVLFSIIGLSAFIETIQMEKYAIYDTVLKVLFIHAIVVIIGGVFWVNLQNILKPITGFTRIPRMFRCTGLTTGFDISGLLCICGIIITLYLQKEININILIVFVLAAFLTSRVSMLIAEIFIFLFILMNKRANLLIKFVFLVVLLTSIIPVLGIVLFTTNNLDNVIVQTMLKNKYFDEMSENLVYQYATTDIYRTIGNHYDFSNLSLMEILLGSMKTKSKDFDPGYTIYIYTIGIVGLLISLSFYFRIIFDVFKKIEDEKCGNVILIISFLCLLLSCKNSYLFTRHVTEILIILFISFQQNNYVLEKSKEFCYEW